MVDYSAYNVEALNKIQTSRLILILRDPREIIVSSYPERCINPPYQAAISSASR